MNQFKPITHYLALLVAAIAAFATTPAGQALAHQYPITVTLFAAASTIAALYHLPLKD